MKHHKNNPSASAPNPSQGHADILRTLDAMKTFGPDSFTGQRSCLFQGAAETTFYVVALYFGSVNIKDSRYTLSIMLLVDLVCVIAGIFVCKLYF